MARLITTDTIQSLFNPVTVSLVGHWPLNEGSGSTLNDVSENGNTLTVSSGMHAWDADTPGSVAGSGGCLQASETVAISKRTPTGIPVSSPITVAFWIKLVVDATNGSARFCVGSASLDVAAFFTRSNIAGSTAFSQATAADSISPINGVAIGSWHHCVVTLDGATGMYYEDGILFEHELIDTIAIMTELLELQILPAAAQTVRVKDLRIYNGVLTPAEIAALAGV